MATHYNSTVGGFSPSAAAHGYCGVFSERVTDKYAEVTCKRCLASVPRPRPRTQETPQEILARCAKKLDCEPRQVYDKLLALLKKRKEQLT